MGVFIGVNWGVKNSKKLNRCIPTVQNPCQTGGTGPKGGSHGSAGSGRMEEASGPQDAAASPEGLASLPARMSVSSSRMPRPLPSAALPRPSSVRPIVPLRTPGRKVRQPARPRCEGRPRRYNAWARLLRDAWDATRRRQGKGRQRCRRTQTLTGP